MNLQLTLHIDDVNYILNTLAEKPFKEVGALIQGIQVQAEAQILNRDSNPDPEPVPDTSTEVEEAE
jgi:hypothetical protein